MGTAYLALDPDRKVVVVKVVRWDHADRADVLKRFDREAQAMRRITSPFVAPILDTGSDGPLRFIVTPYIGGPSLQAFVTEKGPLDPARVRRLAIGIAAAMNAMHEEGVVHRDLKPGNVIVRANGEPVVIDLGIARISGASTLTLFPIGTPGYIAPEVFEGHEAGAPADVFSWAATTVFAATGRKCFEGGGKWSLADCESRLDGVPEGLLPLVRRALGKDPESRPTVQELIGLDGAAVAAGSRATAVAATRADVPVEDERCRRLRRAFSDAISSNDLDKARDAAGEFRRLAMHDADREREVEALLLLGEAEMAGQREDEAAGHHRRALRIAEHLGNEPLLGRCQKALVRCLKAVAPRAPLEDRPALYEELLGLAHAVDDERLALFCYLKGGPHLRGVNWNRVLEMAERVGEPTLIMEVLRKLDSVEDCERLRKMAEELGDREAEVESLLKLARHARLQDDPGRTAWACERALEISPRIEAAEARIRLLCELVREAGEAGMDAVARKGRFRVLETIALTEAVPAGSADFASAVEFLSLDGHPESAAVTRKLSDAAGEHDTQTLLTLAEHSDAHGHRGRAERLYRRACTLFVEAERDPKSPKRGRQLLERVEAAYLRIVQYAEDREDVADLKRIQQEAGSCRSVSGLVYHKALLVF